MSAHCEFLQGGLDLCAAASKASVLSFIGQPSHAKSLFMAFTNNTTARGTHPEIINRVRDKVWNLLDHRLWEMRKLDKDFDMLEPAVQTKWNWNTATQNSRFMLWVLRASDNSASHCVGVVGQWIFDSNLTHALPPVQEALDWCCGANNVDVKYGMGVGCRYQCVQRGYIFRRWSKSDNKKRKWNDNKNRKWKSDTNVKNQR